MRKTLYNVFVTILLVNLGIIIYLIKFYLFLEVLGQAMEPSGKDLEWSTRLPAPPPKYDLDMHIKYRIEVLKVEMKRLAQTRSCSEVMADPLSFWRSQLSISTNFTANRDLDRMKLANRCSFIPIADYIKTPPKPSPYSFELPFLEEPPVTNLSRVSNENTSSVVFLSNSSQFFIGDTVSLLITMRDGGGNLKVKGGDEIRVWFTDTSNPESVLPAKVTDLNNGTYLATVVLAFVGKFGVTVTLVYSREYIQTLIIAHLMIKSTTIYLGAFSNSQANETTVCSHIPVIPGVNQSEVCDLSVVNGSPWFCGRPVKPWLSCTDYLYTRILPIMMTMPMNEIESLLLHRLNKIRPIAGSSNIQLQVLAREDNKGVTRLLSSENCYTVPARRTWEQAEPTGYLYKGFWESYLCRRPGYVTKSCLNDLNGHITLADIRLVYYEGKSVLFLGDSNSRSHYNVISRRSSCREQILQECVAWHKPLRCINGQLNFTIAWLPHSNPFKTIEVQWASIDWITASNVAIDQIPSTGSYLIHVNHYLHATSSHMSAFIGMMMAIKESLVRLFRRNPNVFVVFQEPHIVWFFGRSNSYQMGDTLRRYFISLQYEIFKDLRDQVFYVHTTDMTISIQNSRTHPYVNSQITNFVTGFFCGRHF